jgi:hypothetical protein
MIARLTALILVLCAALTAVALGIGRASAATAALDAAGFDLCDGEPCFRGLVPGHSAWAQASGGAIIGEAESFVEFVYWGRNKAAAEYVSDVYGGALILVRLTAVGKAQLPAGEFILRYGRPCAVGYSYARLVLLYPTLRVEIDAAGGYVTAASSAANVTLQAIQGVYDICPTVGVIPWRGFASQARYVALARR